MFFVFANARCRFFHRFSGKQRHIMILGAVSSPLLVECLQPWTFSYQLHHRLDGINVAYGSAILPIFLAESSLYLQTSDLISCIGRFRSVHYYYPAKREKDNAKVTISIFFEIILKPLSHHVVKKTVAAKTYENPLKVILYKHNVFNKYQ